jgi:hypothetical protein
LPSLEFCSRDATTVRITYIYGRGCEEFIVASAYHPYDSDGSPPTKESRAITDYCHSKKKQLIIGCDSNAHHTLWGSTGTNPRGESFMNFLVSSNLNILNPGNEPTFVVCNRKAVIDLTPGTNKIGNRFVSKDRQNANDIGIASRDRSNINAVSSCYDHVGHNTDILANTQAVSTTCFNCGCSSNIARDSSQRLMYAKHGHSGHKANV